MVEYTATLFSSLSMAACADWLWSGYPVRHPELAVVMAEGGLGWVPMLADRLDYIVDTSGHGRKAWMSDELRPTEVLLRNFWFCSLDDPSMWPIRDRIGVSQHPCRGRLPPRRLRTGPTARSCWWTGWRRSAPRRSTR